MIRAKLFASYLFFILLSSLSGLVVWWLYGQYRETYHFFENFNDLRTKIQQNIALSQRFLLYETINPEFYIAKESEILNERRKLMRSAYQNWESLKTNQLASDKRLMRAIDSIKWFLDEDESIMKSLTEAIQLRGFKDFGMEGKMRSYAHQLEQMKQIDLDRVLLLRRWEKDYMLRNDTTYIHRFEKVLQSLKADFQYSKEITEILDNYWVSFRTIINLDKTIGKKVNEGLNSRLQEHGINTEEYLKNISHLLVQEQQEQINRLQKIFWFALISMILLGLGISFWFSKVLTKPLISISSMLNSIVKNNFDGKTPVVVLKSKDEIGKMTQDLAVMIEKMNENFDMLRGMNQKLIASERALKEYNQIKDKFFSIIAHDLRGPFNTLKGLTNLLINYRDGLSKEEIDDFIYQINQTVINLSNLTNNLLTWALAQTEGVKIQMRTLNLRDAVEDNIRLLQSSADNKSIRLLNFVPADLQVSADENILYFLLRNLISNAIKFSYQNGEVKVSGTEADGKVFVQVIDNGVGMEQALVDKLFQIGEKVSSQGTNQEKGTGLGLILSNEFLKKCNSEISVSSKVGSGSIFTFHLPLVEKEVVLLENAQ